MPLKLNVPYSEKDEAKAKGAFWNPEYKTWFIPDSSYSLLNDFQKWLLNKEAFLIIPKNTIIASTTRDCWKCNHLTNVIAIGANYFFENDYNEEDEMMWILQDFFTLFQNIEIISDELQTALERSYPLFKLDYSKTANGKYWCNHCEHCNAIQGDFYLFDEPGIAFSPMNEQEGSKIKLKNIQPHF